MLLPNVCCIISYVVSMPETESSVYLLICCGTILKSPYHKQKKISRKNIRQKIKSAQRMQESIGKTLILNTEGFCSHSVCVRVHMLTHVSVYFHHSEHTILFYMQCINYPLLGNKLSPNASV